MLTKRDLRDLRLLMSCGIQDKWLLEILRVWFKSVRKRDETLQKSETDKKPPATLFQISVAELHLSMREYNALRRGGVESVGQLVEMTPGELRGLQDIGVVGYKRIIDAVSRFRHLGLALRKEETVAAFEKWLGGGK